MSERATPAQDLIERFGLDAICDRLSGGGTLTATAKHIGVNISTLLMWVEADGKRSARVREARTVAARVWDERAEAGIEAAADPFELSKAKELAFHYRWRSSKIAPSEYGEKMTNANQQLDKHGNPIDPVQPVLEVVISGPVTPK